MLIPESILALFRYPIVRFFQVLANNLQCLLPFVYRISPIKPVLYFSIRRLIDRIQTAQDRFSANKGNQKTHHLCLLQRSIFRRHR